MARTRGVVVRGRSAPRRKTQWLGPPDQAFVNVAAAGATLLASVAIEEPLTVARTRGTFAVKPQSYAADGIFTGAFGIGVVSAEAFAIGITAIPTPFRDADWGGWFVWRSFGLVVEFQSAVGFSVPAEWTFDIDSKAMRKVGPSEVIVTVVES